LQLEDSYSAFCGSHLSVPRPPSVKTCPEVRGAFFTNKWRYSERGGID
jgi:hypothetical protein